jgi:hypothetical protein
MPDFKQQELAAHRKALENLGAFPIERGLSFGEERAEAKAREAFYVSTLNGNWYIPKSTERDVVVRVGKSIAASSQFNAAREHVENLRSVLPGRRGSFMDEQRILNNYATALRHFPENAIKIACADSAVSDRFFPSLKELQDRVMQISGWRLRLRDRLRLFIMEKDQS